MVVVSYRARLVCPMSVRSSSRSSVGESVRALAFGYTTSATGRWGMVLSAARTRRFSRCRFTDNRTVFFEMTIAYPPSVRGAVMEKYADEARGPWRNPWREKSALEILRERGNITGTACGGRCGDVSERSFGQNSTSYAS